MIILIIKYYDIVLIINKIMKKAENNSKNHVILFNFNNINYFLLNTYVFKNKFDFFFFY